MDAASARVGACAITLASSGSKATLTTEPRVTPDSQAHARLGGQFERHEGPRGRQEAVGRVFGAETDLDGAAVESDVVLDVAEGFAHGDAQLLAHQVDAGDRLGHRVLHLQTGVDLEEEELAALVVDQELDGAGRLVTDRSREVERRHAHGRAHAPSSTTGDGDSSTSFWWRRWIEHSRSPRWTRLPWWSPRIWTSTWRERAT